MPGETGQNPSVEALIAAGDLAKAEEIAAAAREADPGSAELHHQVGAIRLRRGDRAGARAAFEEAVRVGGLGRSLNNLGNLALEDGDLEAALRFYERAVSSPTATETSRLNHARCLLRLGRPAEALAAFERAVALDGASSRAILGKAQALRALGRGEQARDLLAQAVGARPEDGELWADYGAALTDLGEDGLALDALERARSLLEGGRPEVSLNLAGLLRRSGRLVEAMDTLARAPAVASLPGFHAEQGAILLELGQTSEAAAAFDAAITSEPGKELATRSSQLFALAHDDGCSRSALEERHRAWGDRAEALHGRERSGPRWKEVDAAAPRIAFFSSDFREHVVMRFLAPLLDGLLASGITPTLVSSGRARDGVTEDLARRFPMLDVSRCTRDEARARVAALGAQILIDLGAHTNDRLDWLTPRIAPVQLHYLGYPGPIGTRSLDYRVSDTIAEADDHDGVDRILRLERCAWAYRKPTLGPFPPRARRETGPRFGCFNRVAKHSPAICEVWTELLRSVPRGRLVLASRGLLHERARSLVLERFALDVRDRVDFAPWRADAIEALARYADVDVVLDTYPYQGTTTTCDALCLGRPVVALDGDRPASRVARSLLTAADAPELIAQDAARYVEIAATLASDEARLGGYAARLPLACARGPLGDGEDLARAFLAALANARGSASDG